MRESAVRTSMGCGIRLLLALSIAVIIGCDSNHDTSILGEQVTWPDTSSTSGDAEPGIPVTAPEIPALTIQASASGGDAPLTVDFTAMDGAAPAANLPAGSTLNWSFGDDTPVAHGKSVNHTFTRGGTFVVALSLTMAGVTTTCHHATIRVQDAGQLPDPALPDLGINLEGVTYWNRQWAFVDVFRTAMPWISQNKSSACPWNTQVVSSIPVDENGYPLSLPVEGIPGTTEPQVVATLVCRSIGSHYPAGRYICLYDGDGQIDFGFSGKVALRQPGRVEVEVNPAESGILIRVVKSTAGNHVRNIRLLMPGFEATYREQPFHPLFLERLRPFHVIRFMDWQRTNNSPNQTWNSRNTPDHYTQDDPRGVALEHMIDLCNQTGTNPWFCIPHQADDDYVRQFATMVHDRLDPRLKVYVEYSNEVWNSLFTQYSWVVSNKVRPDLNQPRNYGIRAQNTLNIFRSVFSSNPSRVTRVLAGQTVTPWILQEILSQTNGDCDAIAIAAYFGADTTDFDADTTIGTLLDHMQARLITTRIPNFAKHKALADQYRVPLISYEGGQSLVPTPTGTTPAYLPLLISVQRDPIMAEVYAANMRAFASAGGRLFMQFTLTSTWNRWGMWGLLEYMDEPIESSVKWQALLQNGRPKP